MVADHRVVRFRRTERFVSVHGPAVHRPRFAIGYVHPVTLPRPGCREQSNTDWTSLKTYL